MKKLMGLATAAKYCIQLSFQTSKLYTWIRIVVNVLTAFIRILSVYPLKYILDNITQSGQSSIYDSLKWLMIMIALNILRILLDNLIAYIENVHDELFKQVIDTQILEKVIDADYGAYDDVEYYNRVETLRTDAYAMPYVLWNVIECITTFVSFAGTFFILGQKNIFIAFFILIVNIPSVIISQKFTKFLYEYDLSQRKNKRKQSYILHIASQKEYAKEIRCFHMSKYLKEKYHTLFWHMFRSKKTIMKKRVVLVELFGVLPEIVNFAVLFYVLCEIFAGRGTVGDFSWYVSISAQLIGAISIFITSFSNVYDNQLKLENMQEFQTYQQCKMVSGKTILSDIRTIEFRDVKFVYPLTDKLILDNVSFTVENGEKVLLVGVNGEGKSTIIKLLLRLYDVIGGEIMINGKNIKEYDIYSLRDAFGIYFQNGISFEFSMKDNMIFGGTEDENRYIQVLRECGGEDILRMCKGNLQVYVGRMFDEEGIEFSIGQLQKIALARALCSDKKCYVLDEPSSSLDPDTEHKVYDYIKNSLIDKTVFFTSHRLSTAHMANRVLVIDDGKIVENGTPEMLLNMSGKFAQLYDYQKNTYCIHEE